MLTFIIRLTSFINWSQNFVHCNPVSRWRLLISMRCILLNICIILRKARFEYLWQNMKTFKQLIKMSALEYVEHFIVWVQGNINNKTMFSSKIDELTKSWWFMLYWVIFKVFYFLRCSQALSVRSLSNYIMFTLTFTVITILSLFNLD